MKKILNPLTFLMGKKYFKIITLLFLLTTLGLITLVKFLGGHNLKESLPDKRVSEVTQIYEFQVAQIIQPKNESEIVKAIQNSIGTISIGGGRFSMGGQVASRNSLHIDMRKYNKVLKFKPMQKKITVQAGIVWRDIQEVIDKNNLSIQIMQTYSNFTVGGSMSVNAHGRYVGKGPLIASIDSFTLIKASGEIIRASREENSDIFYAAIGGYGGIGIISEVTLNLDENTKIERIIKKLSIKDYKNHFYKNIIGNKDIVLTNADIYPPDYDEVLDISWYKSTKELTHEERLIPRDRTYPLQPYLVDFVASSSFGKWVREKIFDPLYYSAERVVWRNWEASYDVAEIEPSSREEVTYVLREYFVPVNKFNEFHPMLKEIFNKNNVNIINVSIRHANKDPGSVLSWARNEVFAFVVYYQQEKTTEAKEAVKKWTQEIIDAVISVGGSYYLPYQPHATETQFRMAYPKFKDFFDVKKKYDPNNRFSNNLWDKYYPENQNKLKGAIGKIKQYYRGEEQTYLTVPEWYLVFNPKEYADFLKADNNPSNFAFLDSLDEYWSLYDKVIFLTKKAYPENTEYITMLQVIGISTTIEYVLKGLYENTLGRLTYFLTNEKGTVEDKIIANAHRAYSDFIFHKAWYEFKFSHWVKEIWSKTDFFGSNFIRKTERKLFFTLEFLIKSLYAEIIGFGAKTAYEASDKFIYAVLSGVDHFPKQIKRLLDEDGLTLIGIPRWGPFTELVPKLLADGAKFKEISGNDEILITGIFETDLNQVLKDIKIFDSRVVSNPKLTRYGFRVPITKLHEIVPMIQKRGELEHIFDY